MAEKIYLNLDKKLRKIIPGFIENRHRDLADLQSAKDQGNFSKIELIGHQLMGSAGSYGFSTLSKLGKDLEVAAQNKSIDDTNLIISKIEDHLNLLEIDYE
jgi:HPt (histidine-containing phosphotransfer) domain-containing protein